MTIILVAVAITLTYFCWPKTEDNDDNDNNDDIDENNNNNDDTDENNNIETNDDNDKNDDIDENNNNIETNEIKTTEVSMIHIEGLQGHLSTSKLFMFIGFSSIFLLMIYAAVHFKCVKLSRRTMKKLEREKVIPRRL